MPLGPRRSSFGASRVSRRSRRKLVWATLNTSVGIAQGTVTGLDLTANLRTAGASVLGATVVRTHLYLQLPWLAVGDFFCLGIMVCRDVDISTGVDPNTNPGDDWMLARQFYPRATAGATVDSAMTYEIDLRSKRKLEELEQRVGLFISNHRGAAGTAQVPVYARTLIALP